MAPKYGLVNGVGLCFVGRDTIDASLAGIRHPLRSTTESASPPATRSNSCCIATYPVEHLALTVKSRTAATAAFVPECQFELS
jgi:hypothetical protein